MRSLDLQHHIKTGKKLYLKITLNYHIFTISCYDFLFMTPPTQQKSENLLLFSVTTNMSDMQLKGAGYKTRTVGWKRNPVGHQMKCFTVQTTRGRKVDVKSLKCDETRQEWAVMGGETFCCFHKGMKVTEVMVWYGPIRDKGRSHNEVLFKLKQGALEYDVNHVQNHIHPTNSLPIPTL